MRVFKSVVLAVLGLVASSISGVRAAGVCIVKPLGHGKDDTDQVMNAINRCGKLGWTIFESGTYNITRKMTWNLEDSVVDLHGVLSFQPDVQYWLNSNNTYRVVFIQNQASWFVVTGKNFVIDAHNTGGINGNGQTWWEYFTWHTKADGDGRPLSLTLYKAYNAVVRNFKIQSPPFWCNTVANSHNVLYDGMTCNATNTNATFYGKNIVPNTDGINTFRSDRVTLKNWDITCGDDCIAVKGNTTNLSVSNLVCHGGNGIAVGSLGQYADLPDIVENVIMEDIKLIRLDSNVQPNMKNGVYLKTWTGTNSGSPPTGGGGGTGHVKNVVARRLSLDRVDSPVHLYQTNGGHSADVPSYLKFSDLTFQDWTGTASSNKIVDLECSANAVCPDIAFKNFNISPPSGSLPLYICQHVENESGLPACNSTGLP